jgi:parvulin-like peptidyl-prolyl isomerase
MMRKLLGGSILGAILICSLTAPSLFAADAVGADVPIASQGGVTVTINDITAFMQRVPDERRPGFLDSPTRINQMIINILRNKQLAKQAVDLKIDQEPEVKAEIAYSAAEILAVKRLNAFDKGLVIPAMDAAAKEEYQAHKKDYFVDQYVEVEHVLITTKNRTDEEAKALAEKVHAEAVAKPADFDALVEKYSEDDSKRVNSGHIRDASSEGVAPEFAAAALKLQPASPISPVIKTKFGYHVLKYIANNPGRQLDFASVKDKIVAKLKANYLNEQRKAFLAKLDDGSAEVNPEIMAVIQKRFIPAGLMTPEQAAKAQP